MKIDVNFEICLFVQFFTIDSQTHCVAIDRLLIASSTLNIVSSTFARASVKFTRTVMGEITSVRFYVRIGNGQRLRTGFRVERERERGGEKYDARHSRNRQHLPLIGLFRTVLSAHVIRTFDYIADRFSKYRSR